MPPRKKKEEKDINCFVCGKQFMPDTPTYLTHLQIHAAEKQIREVAPITPPLRNALKDQDYEVRAVDETVNRRIQVVNNRVVFPKEFMDNLYETYERAKRMNNY